MKKSALYKTVLLLLLAATLPLAQGCIFGKKGGKAVREAEKIQSDLSKETQAEFDEAYKHHMESQSELTKRQMKEMKKLQKRYNKAHKRSLWDRLFRNKCP